MRDIPSEVTCVRTLPLIPRAAQIGIQVRLCQMSIGAIFTSSKLVPYQLCKHEIADILNNAASCRLQLIANMPTPTAFLM